MTYRGGPSIDRRRRQRRRRRRPRCGAAGGGHLLARPHRSLMRRYGRVRRRVDGLRRRPPPPRPGCRRRALLSGTGRCTAGCSPASTSLDGLVFYCGSSPVRAESFFCSLSLSFFLSFLPFSCVCAVALHIASVNRVDLSSFVSLFFFRCRRRPRDGSRPRFVSHLRCDPSLVFSLLSCSGLDGRLDRRRYRHRSVDLFLYSVSSVLSLL